MLMKTDKYHKVFLVNIFTIIVSLALSASVFADLTAESYSQLTIENINLEISDLNELIALAKQYPNDKEAFLKEESAKKKQSDSKKEALFSSYGCTADDYLRFLNKNDKAINDYLNLNPDIKKNIDDLSSSVKTLMEQYESLKKAIINTPPVIKSSNAQS